MVIVMDNIDVRKYIISNFKDSTKEEIKSSINDSIRGLGVMFELLWSNSSVDEQEMILNNIKKGM